MVSRETLLNSLSEVTDEVEVEVETESDWSKALGSQVAALGTAFLCAACGESRDRLGPDGLCGKCRDVVVLIRAQRRESEDVRGQPRRVWCERYVDRHSEGVAQHLGAAS